LNKIPSVRGPISHVVTIMLTAVTALACGSSSGAQIVFVSTAGEYEELYLLDSDTGESTQLTDNRTDDFAPRWSPDGDRVVYLSERSEGLEINLVDRKGDSVTRLTHRAAGTQPPWWSPNGDRLAFIGERDGNPEIYLTSTDGSLLTRVISNSGDNRLGGWSPDGEWLLFFGSGNEAEKGLWLRNPDGVNLVRITTEEGSDSVWSPDSRDIAFVGRDLGNADIYVVSRSRTGTWQADTDLSRLTDHNNNDISPVWSPDGKTIAFVSYRDGNAEIYTMLKDGSKKLRLTKNMSDDLAPVWSPDGDRIAFVSYMSGAGEIFVMASDGSEQRRLTNNDTEDRSPDW